MVMAGPFCRRGGLRGWSSSVGGILYIYLGDGHCLFSVPPPLCADRLDGHNRPAWFWLMTRLEEQYFAIVIQDYLRTTYGPVSGL